MGSQVPEDEAKGVTASSEEPLTVLAGFGLTGYLARSYLALLELGPSQARDVSQRSGVPQGRVYDVLEKLHERGLAEVLPEAPRRYRAVPFEVCLERELQAHRERLETLERDRENLLAALAPAKGVPQQERGEYVVVRGRKGVLERAASVTQGAWRDVLVLGTGRTPQRMQAHGQTQDLAQRSAHLRMLVPITRENADSVREAMSLGAEVRHQPSFQASFPPGLNVMLGDGQRALLYQHLPDDLNTVRGDDVGLLIEHPEMVGGLRALAESLWAIAQPAPQRLEELARGGKEPTQPTILLVDDEPDILDSLRELLTESLEGVRLLTAGNGAQALELLRREPVDLVITDYRMPGMNGLELLEQAAKAAPGARRVLITAFPDLKVAIRAINEAGVERFLTKPFQSSEVIEVIKAVLSERGEQAMRDWLLARAVEEGAPGGAEAVPDAPSPGPAASE